MEDLKLMYLKMKIFKNKKYAINIQALQLLPL